MAVPGKFSIELYRRELVGKTCRRLEKSDFDRTDDLRSLIDEITAILKQSGATGLAAPQVGAYLRLAIIRKSNPAQQPSGEFEALINPEIVNLAGKDLLETECCLSLPPTDEATARIWRSEIVHVRSATLDDPQRSQVTIYKGTMARRVQHEIDHLDGIFFMDRCQPVARSIVLRRFEKYLRQRDISRRAKLVARAVLHQPRYTEDEALPVMG